MLVSNKEVTDELLILHKAASVESAVLLFLLPGDNQGTLNSAVVFLEHIIVKQGQVFSPNT